MRTEVKFKNATFNSTQPQEYFINPNCYGDDVCRWLIKKLRVLGFETDEEPGQEDWGWYFSFRVDGADHVFFFGFQSGDDNEEGQWLGWLERKGLLRVLLRRRHRDVLPAAVEALNAVLSPSPDVRDLQWVEH